MRLAHEGLSPMEVGMARSEMKPGAAHRAVSCNSCHNIMEGGEDSRSVSMGVHGKTGGRNAPTVWNGTPNRRAS